jgi:hypothetical protein
LFWTIVRPRRRTTVDPGRCFNDFSEFRTFIERTSYQEEKRIPADGYSSRKMTGQL